jgi:spore coat protein U-like protein
MRQAWMIAVPLWLAPSWALAQSGGCTVLALPVIFGTYIPFSGTPNDSTGSVTVTCSGAVPSGYVIALNAGIFGGNNFANRRMATVGGFLDYQLYSDPAHTIVWGDGTGGSNVTTGPPCLSPSYCGATYTVYGRIPARQAARPGIYTDVTLVTVTF